MKRARQPAEVALSYIFLASEQESSYMTEQFLHVNGGIMHYTTAHTSVQPRVGKNVEMPLDGRTV